MQKLYPCQFALRQTRKHLFENEHLVSKLHRPAALPVAEELRSLGDNREARHSLVAVLDNFLCTVIKSGQIGSTR